MAALAIDASERCQPAIIPDLMGKESVIVEAAQDDVARPHVVEARAFEVQYGPGGIGT